MNVLSIAICRCLSLLALLCCTSLAMAQDAPPSFDSLPKLGVGALSMQAGAGDAGAALVLGRLLADRTRSAEDHVAAVQYLRQASDAGVAEASVRLADILRNGISGVPADPAGAVELYEIGAAAGDNNARRNLAAMLLSGQGTARDQGRAAGLLQDAANAGNVDARVTLAGLYLRGEGVPQDVEKAVSLYMTGLADRNRGAINGLAALYRRGAPGVEPVPDLALAYYRIGAELDDSGSIRALADMLIRGEGGPADPDTALSLLETLGQRDSGALTALGDYYLGGQVVARDAESAAVYFEMAASAGNAGALVKLGDLYRGGAGTVDIDASRAYEYYSQAAALGEMNGIRKAADMQARGEGTAVDLASATTALEDVGDAGSLVALGDLYGRGEATPTDLPRAIAYYEAAARAGNAGAFTKIAELYRNGAGGMPNGRQAAAFYEKAIEAGDASARRALAAMLADGKLIKANPARAIALLEAGLEAGDAQAGIDLGYAYARGALGEPRLDRTVAAFDAATAMGNGTAEWRKHAAILNGPLAKSGGRSSAAALTALATTVPAAAVELARLIVADKVDGARPAQAIEILKQASGDAGATRYLLQLYREGAGDRLRANPSAAAALLEQAAPILGPDTTRFERVLLNASLAQPARYPDIGADFRTLTRNSGVSAIQRLRQINQNAYVYVVQQWLAETGRYSGSLNGTLTQATIAAFNATCAAAGKAAQCSKGPLSGEAATAIANIMYLPVNTAAAGS